jgi:hypothetical protein
MNKIENLKKITLSFQAGTSKDTMDLTPKYPEFDFIFALGPDGMTPFEYELVDKAEGEEVLLHIHKQTFYNFFEHLNPPIWDLFDDREDVYLKATVVTIAAADSRDIVKAMAEMTAHGGRGCDCGGDCGCGCG